MVMQELIELSVVTPRGEEANIRCDSIRLSVPDGVNGKNGGSVGIRRGHTNAMIALAEGYIVAFLEGQLILNLKIRAGYAAVSRNRVTVLTDGIE